jgi:hypothetical protein
MEDYEINITTYDNPFDPFTEYEKWNDFDIEKGYYTWQKIARIANLSDAMTEKEEKEEIERAILRLIEIDPLDIYYKVTKNT